MTLNFILIKIEFFTHLAFSFSNLERKIFPPKNTSTVMVVIFLFWREKIESKIAQTSAGAFKVFLKLKTKEKPICDKTLVSRILTEPQTSFLAVFEILRKEWFYLLFGLDEFFSG